MRFFRLWSAIFDKISRFTRFLGYPVAWFLFRFRLDGRGVYIGCPVHILASYDFKYSMVVYFIRVLNLVFIAIFFG